MIRKGDPKERAKNMIEVFLSSETMADIVLLFRCNSRFIANKDQIASRIGINREHIEKDLKKLVRLGILKTEKSEKQTWFGFDAQADRQIQEIIEKYIREYEGSK